MRPRTLAITAAAAIASTLLLAGSAGAVLAPQGVIVGPGYQYLGTAAPAGAYIAYSQLGRESSPRLYVKAAGGSPVQITKVGLAYDGGFDGTKVIYQLARPREGRSTIRMYDVVSHLFSEPAGVNTGKWQYGPSMSGDWVLFARLGRHRHLYLHNETTTETRKIASIRKPTNRLDPGQVNGDWAVWSTFDRSVGYGTVWNYQISTGIPGTVGSNGIGKQMYAASVAPNGTVFYVRSRSGCGHHVVLREHVLGGADTALYRVPAGRDIHKTFVVDEGGGQFSVYFDRGTCSGGRSNIYKLTVS